MKFEIIRASSTWPRAETAPCEGANQEGDIGDWYIEISSLEDLLALSKKVGSDLIVNDRQIWIYDDYME